METILENEIKEKDNFKIFQNAKSIQQDINEINAKFTSFLSELNFKSKEETKPPTTPTATPNATSQHHTSSTWWPATPNMTMKMYTRQNKSNSDELPDRIFIKRNSLLTEMFRINHVRTIRHIFMSIMLVLALHVISTDLMEKGTIDLKFDLIRWAFQKFYIACYTWVYMMLSTSCLVYYCFDCWSHNRLYYLTKSNELKQNLGKNNLKNKLLDKYDFIWLIVYVIYMMAFVFLPAYVVVQNQLPVASAFFVLMEQLRMLMKTHAFVRSNIPRAIQNGQTKLSQIKTKLNGFQKENKSSDSEEIELTSIHLKLKNQLLDSLMSYDSTTSQDDDQDEFDHLTNTSNSICLCPNFTNYLYFLFAPTLVYCDTYPRTNRIKWRYVFTNFCQVFGSIMYTYYIFARFCIPVFQHFNTEHVTLKMFIHSILNCTLPGTLLLLVAFFAFLHSWLNAFAEMLRFGDRMFYQDWWNSTNFSNYYRTWNVVVHDWLYTYIYKDCYYLLGKKNKTTCRFIIFIISATFHEYVLTLAFGFFYPVLFVMFGAVGFACMFLRPDKNSNFGNFFTWIGLLIGLGGLMCLYSIEWYARQNCPQSFESALVDYLLPRSFTCGMGKGSSQSDFTLNQIKIDL